MGSKSTEAIPDKPLVAYLEVDSLTLWEKSRPISRTES